MKSWRIALIAVAVVGTGWGAAHIALLPPAWPALTPGTGVKATPAEAVRPLRHYLPIIK